MPFKNWFSLSRFKNKIGALRVVPVLVIIPTIGLIAFLLISSFAPFTSGIFGDIFKKPFSFAASKPRVFVTSTTYNGNLGGVTGADAKCQERATAANLGGDWKAWISDDTATVSARLNHFPTAYSLLDGTKIAGSWDDLVDQKLDQAINISELGTPPSSAYVWTGTASKGQSLGSAFYCNNWTNGTLSSRGGNGVSTIVSTSWSYIGSDPCDKEFALYCFEQ